MPRPKGLILNRDAFEDLLMVRGRTRAEVAEAAGLAASTLSGLTRAVEPHGASLPAALRLAQALDCRPGTLFHELVGRTAVAA